MHEVDSTSWILSILNQWVHPEGWEWLLRERDKDRETDSRLMVVGHLLWTLSAAGPFTESAPLIFKTTLWGGYYSALLINRKLKLRDIKDPVELNQLISGRDTEIWALVSLSLRLTSFCSARGSPAWHVQVSLGQGFNFRTPETPLMRFPFSQQSQWF